MALIFIVEDDKNIREIETYALKNSGYEIEEFEGATGFYKRMEKKLPNLILLDVMLPDDDGLNMIKTIRRRSEWKNIPIILVTAKTSEMDKVRGLDTGADDYLTKPFMTKELLARLRALLRRNIDTADGSLKFGDILLDSKTYELSCEATGQSVRLSEKEWKILEYLIANQNRILTREQLAVKIWGYESDAEYNNVEVYMSFTRKKLAFVGAKTEIKAVRGVGYELRCGDV